jgi:hypothetical protein
MTCTQALPRVRDLIDREWRPSRAAKAVTDHHLGGGMAWSLDSDDGQASLVRAIYGGLRAAA